MIPIIIAIVASIVFVWFALTLLVGGTDPRLTFGEAVEVAGVVTGILCGLFGGLAAVFSLWMWAV